MLLLHDNLVVKGEYDVAALSPKPLIKNNYVVIIKLFIIYPFNPQGLIWGVIKRYYSRGLNKPRGGFRVGEGGQPTLSLPLPTHRFPPNEDIQ